MERHPVDDHRCNRVPIKSTPVHPHGYGELLVLDSVFLEPCGSSPRVWGTLVAGHKLFGYTRFIPTGVGNSLPLVYESIGHPVHPHGCGELDRIPHARLFFWRFIPTGVGNSKTIPSGAVVGTVHPHGCGELMIIIQRQAFLNGSSPRMWGTQT